MTRRFATLDGMRGSAAFAVLLYHAGNISPLLMPSGYLAVDLFFVISGFVLSEVYTSRFFKKMTTKEFIVARIQRLYPLYILGSMFGLILLSFLILIDGLHDPILFVPFNLIMLPWLGDPANYIYPLNPPSWSLLAEMIVNFIFAIALWRIRSAWLILLMAVSAIDLIWIGDVDGGATGGTLLIGIIRALYGFTAGMVIYRIFVKLGRPRYNTVLSYALPFILTVLFATPLPTPLLFTIVILPIIVAVGSVLETHFDKLTILAGTISFPLYCIHAPILKIFNSVAIRTSHPIITMTVGIIFITSLSFIINRYYDGPARRIFGKVFRSPNRLK